MKELHSHFKNSHPGIKVAFWSLQPCIPETIMADASGTHNMCVCTVHQMWS